VAVKVLGNKMVVGHLEKEKWKREFYREGGGKLMFLTKKGKRGDKVKMLPKCSMKESKGEKFGNGGGEKKMG